MGGAIGWLFSLMLHGIASGIFCSAQEGRLKKEAEKIAEEAKKEAEKAKMELDRYEKIWNIFTGYKVITPIELDGYEKTRNILTGYKVITPVV